MEAAIEDMTQVPDSCIVHCKKGEVDEVSPGPPKVCLGGAPGVGQVLLNSSHSVMAAFFGTALSHDLACRIKAQA